MKVLGLATCFNREEKNLKTTEKLVAGNKIINFSFTITDDKSTDGTASVLENVEGVKVLHTVSFATNRTIVLLKA